MTISVSERSFIVKKAIGWKEKNIADKSRFQKVEETERASREMEGVPYVVIGEGKKLILMAENKKVLIYKLIIEFD
jgi:hypothetical protein